jgi:DNA mismatch repair protein MutS2
LIHNYDQSQKELEIQRKKLKVLQKELEFKEQSQGEREIQQFIKELKKDIDKEKTLQKAQEELNRLKEAKEISSKTIEQKKEEIFLKYETVEMGPIEVGSLVKLKNGGLIGEVLEIQKNEVEVQLEHIKIKVKLRDLQKVSSQIEVNQNHKIKAELLGKKSYFEPKIDIRGLRYEDALIELEQFLDEALLTNSVELRIIHGRGTGALKKAVYRKLKEYPGIKEIKYAEANQGGDGQTIVIFE